MGRWAPGFGWQSPRDGVSIIILVVVQPKIHNSKIQMSVIMSNKNIPNNGMKEAGSWYEDLSPGSLGMQGQVPGGCNQATMNKTPLNADNEDNVTVLGEEEWEDLLGKCGNYKL